MLPGTSGRGSADRTGRKIVADGHSQRYNRSPELKPCFQKAFTWERSVRRTGARGAQPPRIAFEFLLWRRYPMRKIVLTLVLFAAALGTLAVNPSKADAAWLRPWGSGYYSYYYPSHNYYPGFYSYGAYPTTTYYSAPYYTPVYSSYYYTPAYTSSYYAPVVPSSYYYTPYTPAYTRYYYSPGVYYYP
jgi:hypothetical protein